MFRLLLIALTSACTACAGSPATTTRPTSDNAVTERRHALIEGLESQDTEIRRRAARESAAAVNTLDPALRGKLFDYLFSPAAADDIVWSDVLRTLAAADDSVVTEMIAAYSKATKESSRPLTMPLLVFGRMGTRAAPAIPSLVHELKKHDREPRLQALLRVVLINAGHDREQLTHLLVEDIRARNEKGEAAVLAVCYAGLDNAVRMKVAKEVAAWLHDQGEKSWEAATIAPLFLATAGDKASKTIADIRRLAERERRTSSAGHTLAAPSGFALASLEGANRRQAIRQALVDLGPYPSNRALMVTLAPWLPAEFVVEIVRMLRDSDDRVVAGAITLLGYVGISAQPNAGALLAVARNSKNDDLREQAAQALASVAPLRVLSELRTILENDDSEDVRDAIQETIRIIELKPRIARR